MSSGPAQASRKKAPSWLYPAIGYGISLACLIWVYHGFNWKTELPKLKAADWRWVAIAMVFDVVVYCVQAWRWRLLLSPVAKPSLLRSIQAVFIGLFANEILPLRSGELIRCYALGRWSGIPYSVTLSSIVIERLFDGILLIL